MKREILIVFMLVASVGLVLAQATQTSFNGFDAKDSLGLKSPPSLALGSDKINVEDKMKVALIRLESWKTTLASGKNDSEAASTEFFNSSESNSSTNSSSALNSSEDTLETIADGSRSDNSDSSSASTVEQNSSIGKEGLGSGSKANFNGYYGMTASQHEMGKSNIKSEISLKGSFEIEKSVKFQDHGF